MQKGILKHFLFFLKQEEKFEGRHHPDHWGVQKIPQHGLHSPGHYWATSCSGPDWRGRLSPAPSPLQCRVSKKDTLCRSQFASGGCSQKNLLTVHQQCEHPQEASPTHSPDKRQIGSPHTQSRAAARHFWRRFSENSVVQRFFFNLWATDFSEKRQLLPNASTWISVVCPTSPVQHGGATTTTFGQGRLSDGRVPIWKINKKWNKKI